MYSNYSGFWDSFWESMSPEEIEQWKKDREEQNREYALQWQNLEAQLDSFIAAGERDIQKMDTVFDPYYCYQECPEPDAIIRKYIEYLSKFSPGNAQERLDKLESIMGFKSVIVYAAAFIALSFGTLNNGCEYNSTFAQLLTDAKNKENWKDKVVIFLHDVSKNTRLSVPELMKVLKAQSDHLISTPQEKWDQHWMDDLMEWDAETPHPLTDQEADEIAHALMLLNPGFNG